MPCYHPITAWRSKYPQVKTGKHALVFYPGGSANPDEELQVPCGQCIGCRLERSRQWAIRCVHESSLYDQNAFITLTYDPDQLPSNGSLVKHHFVDFMKRLRKRFNDRKIRYYMCGEYGSDDLQPTGLGRPHFHACLFNVDLPDRVLFSVRDDIKLYSSEILDRLWGKGYTTVGDVTFDSAAYCARYIAKKITGDQADTHYFKINYDTGEFHPVEPEYNSMSTGDNNGSGGIGKQWWTNFKNDTLKDFITVKGKKQRPPKYYDKLLELNDTDILEAIKEDRKLEAFENFYDNLPSRLKVKETIKLKKYKQLPRELT